MRNAEVPNSRWISAAPRLTSEEYRLAEVSIAFSQLFRRRLKAIRWLREGQSVPAVAAQLGVSRRSVYDWIARYERDGINGLVDRRRSGRPSRITDAYVQYLLELLTCLERLPAEGWRADMLIECLRQKTGISVSRCRFYRLLHSLGYAFHSINLYQNKLRVWSGYTWIRTQGLPQDGITFFLRSEVTSYQSLPDTPFPREEKPEKHCVSVFSVRRLVRRVPIAVAKPTLRPTIRQAWEHIEAFVRRRREQELAQTAAISTLRTNPRRRRKAQERRRRKAAHR